MSISFAEDTKIAKKSRKGVGFASPDEEEIRPWDHVAAADPDRVVRKQVGITFQQPSDEEEEDEEEDNGEAGNDTENYSELDPMLLFTANNFVHDLMEKAQDEARRRHHSQTEELLPGSAESFRGRGESIHHVREEIGRKCRNFYSLFLRCIGGLQ